MKRIRNILNIIIESTKIKIYGSEEQQSIIR